MLKKFNPRKTRHLKQINRLLRLVFHTPKPSEPLDFAGASRILIVDFGLLGDVVMLIPFLRALRDSAPHARITYLCGPWGPDVLDGLGLVDEYVLFAGRKEYNTPFLMLKNRAAVRKTLAEVNGKRYDLAIAPRGDLRENYLMYRTNSARKISYNYTGGECFLTDVYAPSPDAEHLVEDSLSLAEAMGCPVLEENRYPCLHLDVAASAANERFLEENGLAGRYRIGIHPGASYESKKWGGYPRLVEELHRKNERAVFLIFAGPGEEKDADAILTAAERCGARAVSVREPLRTFLRLLAVCDYFFGNDSGAAHLAVAQGVPATVIFGPTEPALGRPYAEPGRVRCVSKRLPCKPCLSMECREGARRCMTEILPAEVAETLPRAGAGGNDGQHPDRQ